MSDSAEEGIALTQVKAAQEKGAHGLKEHHGAGIAYLNERILVFVLAISLIGLALFWALSDSTLLVLMSLVLVIIVATLTAIAWIKRIERTRQDQAQQAREWRPDKSA